MPEPRIVRGYELIEPLGRSAERTTWRARRARDGAEVAVKELLFHAMASWKTEELFEREARVLRQIDHPRVPRLLDAFSASEGARDGLYLVRELVPGQSLEEELRARAHPPREVAEIAAELCAIAGDLHALTPPIVHRDLTLANVIQRDDGALVAIDLGAVKDTLAPHGSTIAGTYGFMAPEQLRGEASPASDVYAIGAIALSLLARRPVGELLDVHHRLRIEQHVPRGPMRRVLSSMLAPSARARPSARDAERALRAIARGAGTRAMPAALAGAVAIGIVGVVLAAGASGAEQAPVEPTRVAPPPSPPPAPMPPEPPVPLAPPQPIVRRLPPPPERGEPPELEGWTPRCAARGCASVEESFAGISLDEECGPLVPAEGEAAARSQRADRIAVRLGTHSAECTVEQQRGLFCNVLCELPAERPWELADELRAWIGDRHGAPTDADEHVASSSPGLHGLPPMERLRRTWRWESGDTFAPEVMLSAERSSGVAGEGRVVVSYRGRFRRPS